MKVFLSWSGDVSKHVAEALREWLPYMVQSIKPFVSSGDISKGDTWSDVLAHELKGAEYGIICVTPYNVNKPWMIFEAGAMSHFVGRSRVTPLLFRVAPDILDKGPLAQFQSTSLTRDDFYRLIFSINSALPVETQLGHELLENNFNTWWTKLKADLDKIPSASAETRTFYKWLRTFDDLSVHDLTCDCKEVWIVASDVFRYATQFEAKQRIIANLEDKKLQHVVYRFLCPAGPDIHPYLKDMMELKTKYAPRFDYRLIEPDLFGQRAPSDFVMIRSASQNTLKVFVKAPIVDSGSDYWFDAEQRAADGFFRRFENLWNTSSEEQAGVASIASVSAKSA